MGFWERAQDEFAGHLSVVLSMGRGGSGHVLLGRDSGESGPQSWALAHIHLLPTQVRRHQGGFILFFLKAALARCGDQPCYKGQAICVSHCAYCVFTL